MSRPDGTCDGCTGGSGERDDAEPFDADRAWFQMHARHADTSANIDAEGALQVSSRIVVGLEQRCHPGHYLDTCGDRTRIAGGGAMVRYHRVKRRFEEFWRPLGDGMG